MRFILLSGLLMVLAGISYGYSGLSGHQLDGLLEASPYYTSTISEPQNASNLGSPLASVDSGVEFSADFQDCFTQQWHLTADLQDNYQVVLRETSPLSQANIGTGDWMVRWHFYGFDFSVAGVELVSGPDPDWDTAIMSFDAQNVWIDFNHLYEVPSQGTYTFQIVPVPEPATTRLLGLGGVLCLILRRAKSSGCRNRTSPSAIALT